MVSRSRVGNSNRSTLARLLTIGEVARRSGFSIKALRFYERRGLLPPSGLSPSGYRLYSEADLRRLDFIRQAKALGLALDQVRDLVSAAREQSCSMTRPRLLSVLDERIRQTARQIETLTRLKKELERRRGVLARKPPTDHRLGYCECFADAALIQVSGILPKVERSAGASAKSRASSPLAQSRREAASSSSTFAGTSTGSRRG